MLASQVRLRDQRAGETERERWQAGHGRALTSGSRRGQLRRAAEDDRRDARSAVGIEQRDLGAAEVAEASGDGERPALVDGAIDVDRQLTGEVAVVGDAGDELLAS